MRLLIVEDEGRLVDYLVRGLTENGYVVDVARDGIEGRRLAAAGDYSVVLLDVMLPGIDGFGVLRAMRARSNTPVLMLTARDKVEDRVRGLQEGADDYLVKPFAFSELLARISALMRRGSGGASNHPTTLKLAELEVDLLGRKVMQLQGAGLRVMLEEIETFCAANADNAAVAEFIGPLREQAAQWQQLTMQIGQRAVADADEVGAAA